MRLSFIERQAREGCDTTTAALHQLMDVAKSNEAKEKPCLKGHVKVDTVWPDHERTRLHLFVSLPRYSVFALCYSFLSFLQKDQLWP